MRFYIPISVSTLNTNIDADLNLGAGHGIRTDWIETSTGTNNLTLGRAGVGNLQTICRLNNLAALELRGGDYTAGSGGFINIGSKGMSGGIQCGASDAAGTGGSVVMQILGVTDTPFLNLLSHRIAGILDPTTAQDALTHHTYADWTPTLVWATATPSGVSTTARWVKIGNTVFWYFRTYSADSNATTGLTFTLPSTPGNHGSVQVAVSGSEIVNTTLYSPRPYVTMSGAENRCQFWSFQTGVDAQAILVSASGFYEES
jgi:hypothetical protein